MNKGIGVSKGIAFGKVLVLVREDPRFISTIAKSVQSELVRLEKAIQLSIKQLENIREHAPSTSREIMSCHIMILQDPELKRRIESSIRNYRVDAATATQDAIGFLIDEFEQIDDIYLSERALDLRDVRFRLKTNILGRNFPSIHEITEPVIVVTEDISPSLIATVNPEKLLGIITERGGKTSHTAIMANSMGIPAIVGFPHITKHLKTDDVIGFNGDTGEVFLRPNETKIQEIKTLQEAYRQISHRLKSFVNLPTLTKDRKQIFLTANVGSLESFQNINTCGGEGIGLFRTEFLYLERETYPSEEEQYQIYKRIATAMGEKPVVARTLDVGGDKQPSYMKIPREANPFLGYRAIRLCLDHPEMFKTQLRALLRASVHGNLKIMYPMISSLEEFRAANALLKEAMEELKARKEDYNENIKVGVTMETPAAALLAAHLAKEADFFSIGTNDLVQYTVAVDRMNEMISHIYNPLNPSVVYLVKHIIDCAHQEGISVSVCGEIARDSKIVPLLIGLGIDELSMNMGSILEIRNQISSINFIETQVLAEKILICKTADEISTLL